MLEGSGWDWKSLRGKRADLVAEVPGRSWEALWKIGGALWDTGGGTMDSWRLCSGLGGTVGGWAALWGVKDPQRVWRLCG